VERGKGTAGIKESEEQTDEVVSIYSGYTPHSLLKKPTPSILGDLPPLVSLDKSVLPPLDNLLKKNSNQNYRKGIERTRVNVPIPPLVLPPPTPEQFLQKFMQKKFDREKQYPPARTYYEHRQRRRGSFRRSGARFEQQKPPDFDWSVPYGRRIFRHQPSRPSEESNISRTVEQKKRQEVLSVESILPPEIVARPIPVEKKVTRRRFEKDEDTLSLSCSDLED
jgi:hypothetical protein